jgi:hypothetical protein
MSERTYLKEKLQYAQFQSADLGKNKSEPTQFLQRLLLRNYLKEPLVLSASLLRLK